MKKILNMFTVYDPKHFCQSWCKCCEENLALKPKVKTKNSKKK